MFGMWLTFQLAKFHLNFTLMIPTSICHTACIIKMMPKLLLEIPLNFPSSKPPKMMANYIKIEQKIDFKWITRLDKNHPWIIPISFMLHHHHPCHVTMPHHLCLPPKQINVTKLLRRPVITLKWFLILGHLCPFVHILCLNSFGHFTFTHI